MTNSLSKPHRSFRIQRDPGMNRYSLETHLEQASPEKQLQSLRTVETCSAHLRNLRARTLPVSAGCASLRLLIPGAPHPAHCGVELEGWKVCLLHPGESS